MKSLAVIKNIIPLLSSIQAGGAFSNPLVAIAGNWTTALGQAAIEDRIDLSEVLTHFDAMATATDFETQQDEMATTLALLEALLEDIPAGRVPEYVAPPEGFETVRLRLSASIAGAVDAYRIEPAKLEAMRRDAAALAALSMGEEDLNEDARLAADRIHDLVDRSVDADYLGRRAYLTRARADMERIAA